MENVSLLLDILTQDINTSTKNLLSQPDLKEQSLSYLESIISNDDLLSTSFITPSSTITEKQRTISEEIAELDSKQRKINDDLKKFTGEHKEVILNYQFQLNDFQLGFKDFQTKIHEIVFGLEEYNSNLQLQQNEELSQQIEVKANLLSNMNSITDLLELPTLLKLCILQGNYQESLEIAMYLHRLLIRFPKLIILQQLQALMEKELKIMLSGLIKLLNTNIKQNSIYKVFQILKKLDPYSKLPKLEQEVELKQVFFTSRIVFILGEIDSLQPIKKHNLENYLRRCIEVIREFGFNSIIIYQSIFPSISESKVKDTQLLNFVKKIATHLIDIIVENFPLVTEKIIKDGLILQLIYCCQSLSKFSLDFQSLVVWELIEQHQIIDDMDWFTALKKQKGLNKNLFKLVA